MIGSMILWSTQEKKMAFWARMLKKVWETLRYVTDVVYHVSKINQVLFYALYLQYLN